jgi:hypothetical protein
MHGYYLIYSHIEALTHGRNSQQVPSLHEHNGISQRLVYILEFFCLSYVSHAAFEYLNIQRICISGIVFDY